MTTSRLQPKQLDRAFAVVQEGIERGEADRP